MNHARTARRIALCILFLGLAKFVLIGCTPPPPTEHMLNVTELTSILPSNTRGAMAANLKTLLTGDSAAEVTDLLNGEGTDAALNEPFSAITAHSLGMDLQAFMDTSLLTQTTDPESGLILLAKLNVDNLEDAIDVGSLVVEPSYKTYPVYSEPSSGLNVTWLPGRIFVVGQPDSVKSVIDVYVGDAVNAETGAQVGAYLVDLASGPPTTFVYGLPGMYKPVAPSVTLNGSQAVSVELTFSHGTLSGEASFYTDNATQFASSYFLSTWRLLLAYPAEAGKAKRLAIPIRTSPINKSEAEIIASRHELKKLFYIMEAKDYASGIESGASNPWANFFVDEQPPSIFINYEIPESQVAAFSAAVLPAGFEMMKLRILESDTPAYYLVLNIYTALGLAPGVRFEWSVFIKDPDYEKPRFLVIQPLAEGISLDPVNLWTLPEPVSHVLEGNQLISIALQDQGSGLDNYFTSTITWPQASPQIDRTTREFVTANDYIFWRNGVADHGLYSGSVHNRDVVVIPPSDYEIINDTPWFAYVNPEPNSVYVYQNALDIIVSPWWNLDAPYLDVTPGQLQTLIDLKAQVYSGLISLNIKNAFKGRQEAITPFDAGNSIPSAYFNYIVPSSQAGDFEAALRLPSGYSLAKTKILEDDPQEEYYVTLNVYNIDNAIEGTRAEWSVYVDDGNGRERFMIIDLMTEDAALSPMTLLNVPSVVEHTLVGDQLSTTLISSTIDFSATLDVSDGVEALQTLDWVEARDFVCSLNGICDKNYFGEGTLEAPLLSVNPALVTVSTATPWSAFIGSEPSSILLRTNEELFAKKAWFNVQP